MRSKLTRSLALATMAANAGIACAQTFNEPKYFIWGDYPEPNRDGSFDFSTSLVRKFTHFNMEGGIYRNGQYQGKVHRFPELLAEDVADYILSEKALGRLEDSSVAVIIQNFGYDSPACDAPQGQAEDDLDLTRFFNLQDRLPGVGEWASDPAPRFPKTRDDDIYMNRQRGDFGEARAYRHPFIVNGLADLPDGTVRAPLRAWMKRFINRLDQIYTNNERPGLPNPSTFRYYMDVEPVFIFEDTQNGIFLLDFLANPSLYDSSNSSNYWSNPAYIIPGTAQTLQASYDAYRLAHGYDTGADPWPEHNPALWLDPGANGGVYHPHNAPILTWYHEVAQHVRDAVLDNCFHSVIREKWPNSAVKTGNYSDFSTDGAADVFGWEGDRPWLGSVASSNNDPPTFAASEQSHRWFINKARGGGYYYLAPPTNVPEKRRFLDIVTKSSGTVDSPVCYSLAPTELYGVDGPNYGRPGHMRAEPYSLGNPEETPWQTALRVHRHSIESAINSVPPTGTHNSAREMVPWTLMPGSDDYDNPLAGDFISRSDARAMLGLFRGKNVKEGLYWTNWSPPPQGQDPSEYWTKLGAAWRDTQDSVSRVYSTRVKKYTRTWSGSTMPSGSAYSDASETATRKAERLEFTLREAGTDREVELTSKVMPQTGPSQQAPVYQTQLVADFDWKDSTYTGAYSNGSYPSSEIHFEINVECSIAFYEQTGHVPTVSDFGLVQIWSQAINQYVTLPGDIANTSYTFVAPQSGDSRWRMRLHFEAKNISGGIFPDTGANNAPRTRIRLLQQSPLKFVTRYDLVQVWPFIPPAETSLLMGSPLSDINGDGIVDETDLTVYVDEFMAGTPAADLNLDDSIDDGDASAFIEAYVTGT